MKTCPSLDISLYIASLTKALFSSMTYVWIGYLSTGGVSIKERLLIPTKDICKVLGIGVAVKVSTSTFSLYSLIFSLWVTPNLCSSSITKSPKSLGLISLPKSLCVPNNISIFPSFNAVIILLVSFKVVNLFNKAISTGKSLNLIFAFSYCCEDKIVVGHK